MNTYLVGGAVRDQLLGLPVKDRDWVVVGATPAEMVAAGYKSVGKDFPVFLHPETHEEYALARTERKTSAGYHGFEFYTDTSVTLEDDLIRRDLSINAMAQNADGSLVDPYNGKADLENRVLRHVSPAFAEDPVRILRVARFAARYAHLGFNVADETLALMNQMVTNGEADALVAERVWAETDRALGEKSPAVYFQTLRDCGALNVVFPEVDALFGVPQRKDYHPEIDTGIHTMMVLEQAALLSDDPMVRFAALVHDLGKAKTPADVLPRHIGHEKASLPLVNALCARLKTPSKYRELALLVAEHHGACHRVNDMKASTLVDKLHALDAYRRPERFQQFLTACEADYRGRTGFEARSYTQKETFFAIYNAANSVDTKSIAQQHSGAKIKEAIRLARINAIRAASLAS